MSDRQALGAPAPPLDLSSISVDADPAPSSSGGGGPDPEAIAASPREPPPDRAAAARIAELERQVRELRGRLDGAPRSLSRAAAGAAAADPNGGGGSAWPAPPQPKLPAAGQRSKIPAPLYVLPAALPPALMRLVRAHCIANYLVELASLALGVAACAADSPWQRCIIAGRGECKEPFILLAFPLAYALFEAANITYFLVLRCLRDKLPTLLDAVPLLWQPETENRTSLVQCVPLEDIVEIFLCRERAYFSFSPGLKALFFIVAAAAVAVFHGAAPLLPGQAALAAATVLVCGSPARRPRPQPCAGFGRAPLAPPPSLCSDASGRAIAAAEPRRQRSLTWRRAGPPARAGCMG